MQTVTLPVIPSRYRDEQDKWGTPDGFVLRIAGTVNRKHAVGYVGPNGTARRVQGGPILPGPYAYAYGLASVLSDRPQDAPLVLDVEAGDHVVIQGVTFQVTVRGQFPYLEEVGE